MSPLITNLDSGDDKRWAKTFLFIRTESLGSGFDYLRYPPLESAPDWNHDPLDEEAVARIDAFLSIPEEERTWPASLGRELLPRYMKTKLSGVRVPKGKPSSTALSLFRSSARLASFSAKDLKAGVARIAEQSKSQEASGSDKTLDILVSDVQPPQEPPRLVSPEVVQASKRRREDVIPEEEGGEKEPIQAQPIRSIRQVSVRIDDMDAARARINKFSAKMGGQLLSANTLESSTKVVSILTSLVTKAAELVSQAKEGLDVGLARLSARGCQARVSTRKKKRIRLTVVGQELEVVKGEWLREACNADRLFCIYYQALPPGSNSLLIL
ncbi:uncharacterized protein LOC141588213 [Silene latifolia]|uniref:uncharacterized protein LOC141588213 n=1 Tax=Silene latifolia TaxID=37657 RepID=UPI003D781312